MGAAVAPIRLRVVGGAEGYQASAQGCGFVGFLSFTGPGIDRDLSASGTEVDPSWIVHGIGRGRVCVVAFQKDGRGFRDIAVECWNID
ncbi:hypothetical protein F5X71_30720 [Nocardia brasiliensis]|uniref:Uncharacterized protein n=1 Tax=Nocardia brasiliensis TaxID=37326 RepID=A0A6G9XYT2_NOCBR|nr:hypothetical protein [Nocardia brasiliensis]QIS06099.1 hypothetical protein F5X71_30720 [Nocardia brasiliensis]